MKLFFGLMAVLLLSLSFFPCGDKQECVKDTSSMLAEANHEASHNQSTEYCAPFCSCACCSVVFYSEVTIKNFTSNINFSLEIFPSFSTSFHNNVFSSIWHPPQLTA